MGRYVHAYVGHSNPVCCITSSGCAHAISFPFSVPLWCIEITWRWGGFRPIAPFLCEQCVEPSCSFLGTHSTNSACSAWRWPHITAPMIRGPGCSRRRTTGCSVHRRKRRPFCHRSRDRAQANARAQGRPWCCGGRRRPSRCPTPRCASRATASLRISPCMARSTLRGWL